MLKNLTISLTRTVSDYRITDSVKILRYVFRCRNMNKAALLDPNSPKTLKL